jgi:hypothetical protein
MRPWSLRASVAAFVCAHPDPIPLGSILGAFPSHRRESIMAAISAGLQRGAFRHLRPGWYAPPLAAPDPDLPLFDPEDPESPTWYPRNGGDCVGEEGR